MKHFRAYVDESAADKGDPSFIGVAAYLVPTELVSEMDERWADLLQRYKIPFFHTVDCLHQKRHFRNLKRGECDAAQRAVIDLIGQYAVQGFAVLANPLHFDQGLFPGPANSPYVFATVTVLMAACAWANERFPGAQVAFFYECGDRKQALADAALSAAIAKAPSLAQTYKSHEFAGKRELRLLQAADVFAYHSVKYLKDQHAPQPRAPRKDFLALVKRDHTFIYLSATSPTDVNMFFNNPGKAWRHAPKLIRGMANDPGDLAGLKAVSGW